MRLWWCSILNSPSDGNIQVTITGGVMPSWQNYSFGTSLTRSNCIIICISVILHCLLNSSCVQSKCTNATGWWVHGSGLRHRKGSDWADGVNSLGYIWHLLAEMLPMALPFLIQGLLWLMGSKFLGAKTQKVPNSNHVLQICLTFVIHFFLIFDARPSSEFFQYRSNRGRIMAICSMSFHHLSFERNFNYIFSDKSSNIL